MCTRRWLVAAGMALLSAACATRNAVAPVPDQSDEVRHHAQQRLDGRDAWVSTAFICGNGEAGVAVRSRDEANVLLSFDYVADRDATRWSVKGAGLSREMKVTTRARGDASVVTIAGMSWELPEHLSDEAMISARRAIRASMPEADLRALERIRQVMRSISFIEWIGCPVDPTRSDQRKWHCGAPTPKVESITLPPDCDFDASVGYPCGKERAANVRAAKKRGELLEKY